MRRSRKRNTLEPLLADTWPLYICSGGGGGGTWGCRTGRCERFVGFEIHTGFHDFGGKKILSSQLGVFWVQFLVLWILWVLIRLAFYFCLHSHHNKSYHQTPISRQRQWNSSTSPPRPKLTKRLVFLLFENHVYMTRFSSIN